jgi:uncharacterized membrane protein YkvA (DUF1232 family)
MDESRFTPSDEQINEALNRNKNRAEEYLHDPDKSRQLLETAVKKADQHKDTRIPQMDFWAQLKAFFRLLKAYTRREYTVIPWGSIVLITGAIIYFVTPIDLVLDWIPLLGYVDDAAVVVFVIRQIRSDLDKFLVWEANKEPSQQIIDLKA